jgi:hypothetical protein
MKTIDINIRIEYDPARFPEADMNWAIDKITECDPVWNIGYDFDAFAISSTVAESE